MNYEPSRFEYSEMMGGMSGPIDFLKRQVKTLTKPGVMTAIKNGPAGQAAFAVLPKSAQNVLRKGSDILTQTKNDITAAVQKSANAEVRSNMKSAGLLALGILGLGAGA